MGAPPLVGRQRELAWLEQRLDDALAGRPQAVLVSGDPGVGKSRLVRELQRVATARGAEVCSGRCREQLELPYLPFVGSLFGRLEQLARDDPELHDYAPVIGRLLGHAPPTAGAGVGGAAEPTPDQEQTWLFLAVTRATTRLARQRPLVVVVDDLHWADRPSLEVLGHLVLEVADASLREPVPLMIVATYRRDPGPVVARELARLRREEICHSLDLDGFGEAETGELMHALGLRGLSRRVVGTVQRATRGNPLFIENTAHQLSQTGAVDERGELAGAAAYSINFAVPDELTDTIAARIDEVSNRCRDLLTLASFLGDEVTVRDLSALNGEFGDDLPDLVDEALDRGLLVEEGPAFRFAHPLYCRVLYGALGAKRRRRTHLAVADALDRLAPAEHERRVLEIAHHLIESGPLAEPARLLERARAAGEQASAMLAWADAARCFEAAADAGERMGVSSAELGQLHFRAGVAHYRNMDAGPSRAHLERAIVHDRDAGDDRGAALAQLELARAELLAGKFGTAVDVSALEEALASLADRDPGLAARVLAQLGEARWVRGDVHASADLARQALELGRTVTNHAACTRALASLAVTAWLRLDLAEALESLEEALTHARQDDDPWYEGLVLPRLALTLLWLGRLGDAERMATEATANSRRTGDWAEHSLASAALVGVAVARGDFAGAERHGADAWSALRIARYGWAASLFLPALAGARAMQGDSENAERALDQWAESDQLDLDVPLYEEAAWVARRLVRALAGETAAVAIELEGRPELLKARWPVALGTVSRFAALVELAALTGVDVDLDRVERALHRAAQRGMVVTDGHVFLVPRVLGLVARLRGRDDEAEARLREAIAIAERLGLRPELARASLEYGRVLVERPDVTDRERGLALGRRAARLFHELGMPALEQQAAELVAARAAPPAAPALPSDDMAVILFTDIANSTALNEQIGDVAYRARADTLDTALRSAIEECGGRAIEGITLGDGILAVFGSARRAIECAERAHGCARSNDFELHLGIHAGDVLRSPTGVHGGAVHIAARVCAEADAGETLVSETIRSLARTSAGVTFEDRGLHDLKGVGDPVRIFAVVPAADDTRRPR